MKLNDITVLLLLYKTSRLVLKNLKYYKNFKVLILDQSNDRTKKEMQGNYKNGQMEIGRAHV